MVEIDNVAYLKPPQVILQEVPIVFCYLAVKKRCDNCHHLLKLTIDLANNEVLRGDLHTSSGSAFGLYDSSCSPDLIRSFFVLSMRA